MGLSRFFQGYEKNFEVFFTALKKITNNVFILGDPLRTYGA